MAEPVHVIGASGRSGAAFCHALAASGTEVVPVVRDLSRWHASFPGGPGARVADLTNGETVRSALHDAVRVVSCAHARHAGAIIASAPATAHFVFLGSTRKFTLWPDSHGTDVLRGERAFFSSGRRGWMLHPTMIYGAQGEDNVQRLARLLRRLPIVPLPRGGASLVQPIFQGDLTRCLLAALDRSAEPARALVVAGPAAMSYADFVGAVSRAAGLAETRVLPLPAWLLMAAAAATRLLPGVPTVGVAEVRRLLEDKAFDIAPMIDSLGVKPVTIEEGLARTFATQRTNDLHGEATWRSSTV